MDCYVVCNSELEQFGVLRFLYALVPTFATHGNVFVVAADEHLLARGDDVAVGIDTGVDGGLATARAAGFHLLYVVGQLEKPPRAGEKVRLEIGAQAVAHYIYVQYVHSFGQLVYLLFAEKLGLAERPVSICDKYSFFSLLNITGCAKGITINGAKYPLADAEISCEYQYGISNEVLPGEKAVVSVKCGKLLLIKVR